MWLQVRVWEKRIDETWTKKEAIREGKGRTGQRFRALMKPVSCRRKDGSSARGIGCRSSVDDDGRNTMDGHGRGRERHSRKSLNARSMADARGNETGG